MDLAFRRTRREFLQGTAALALWGSLAADLAKQADAATPSDIAGDDPDLHLLRRISFGPTLESLARIRSIGAEAYLEEQLSLRDTETETDVALRYPLTTLDAAGIYSSSGAGFAIGAHVAQLQAAMIYRAIRSEAQLFEVMVDFWNDHFNTYIYKNNIPLKISFDRDVIRAHALGDFRSLLKATVRHAEMLHYLDNWINTAGAINENYSRELLELHTLGKDGGYTEQDLKELARILSGLSYASSIAGDPLNGVLYADAVFNASQHDDGAKVFLGQTFAAGGGEADIDRALDLMLDHPSTARHIARKLCQRFVSDEPAQSLVERVAASFRNSGGDIPEMLRVIFSSAEFATSAGEKFRRPMQAVAGAARACGIQAEGQTLNTGLFGTSTGGGLLFQQLSAAGQAPFGWVPPDGYPDGARYWANTNALLHQQRFLVALAESASYDRLLRDPQAYLQQGNSVASEVARAATPREALDNCLQHLMLTALPSSAYVACLNFMAQDDDADAEVPAGELQNRIKGLVFVLLSSPWFLLG